MSKLAAFVALAAITAVATAANQIDIKARIVGTTDWLDSITFVSTDGSPLNLEVAVFYHWTSGADGGVGFSGCTHNVVVNSWNVAAGDTAAIVDNAASSSHPDGRLGNFNKGGQSQAFFTTGIDAGRLRIGAPTNTGDVAGGGISVKQGTPVALGGAFDTSNPAFAYRFNISIARDHPGASVRHLNIDAPLNKVSTTYGVYRDLVSTTVLNRKASLLPTDGVEIAITWDCPDPITIEQQPADQSVSGGTATFSLLATGNELAYQWRKGTIPLVDDARITGAATPSLSISEVQTGDLGNYDCVISNGCGTVSSDTATLACETPVITQQPADQPIYPGQTAIFSVTATGTNLDFQWMKNSILLVDGPRISGSNLPTLSIANVQTGDQATYECVVFNSCSGLTSAAAQLTCSPVIAQQPPATIRLRAGLVLSVGVPTGSAQSFRWRRDGQNLFNVAGLFSGVTTKTLLFLSNDPSIPGGFDCVLTNSCGSVTTTMTTVFCPSDFNSDGFVTGDDYDDYREAFIAGDISSDFDGDTFVTGDDFDAYVAAFVEGC